MQHERCASTTARRAARQAAARTLTVQSADAEASTFRNSAASVTNSVRNAQSIPQHTQHADAPFHATPSTASVWLPGRSTGERLAFLLGFAPGRLPVAAAAVACASSPPSTITGSDASSTSRSHSSIAGIIVPTATKLPRASPAAAPGGQSSHAKDSGKAEERNAVRTTQRGLPPFFLTHRGARGRGVQTG